MPGGTATVLRLRRALLRLLPSRPERAAIEADLLPEMSAQGLRQSFGLMVNCLYDLGKVEASHAKLRQVEVVRSRAIELRR